MKLRHLLLLYAQDIAVTTGCTIRLIPKDLSRSEKITVRYLNDELYVDYRNDVDSITICNTCMGCFKKEIEKYLDLDAEDWTVCPTTVSALKSYILDAQAFIGLVENDSEMSK